MEILELSTSDMRQKILFDCGGDFFTVMVRQEFMFIGNKNARDHPSYTQRLGRDDSRVFIHSRSLIPGHEWSGEFFRLIVSVL